MDREKEAWEKLQQSTMSGPARWILMILFLVGVGAIFVADLWKPFGPRDAVLAFTGRSRPLEPSSGIPSKVLEWNREVLADIDAFENQIAEESILRATIPYYQWVFLRVLSTSGTGRVIVGRDGWYFLKEGLETTLGWGSKSNLQKADETVRQLAGRLAELDIDLILMPVPGKAELYPARFSSRFTASEILPILPRREQIYGNWDDLPGVTVVNAREAYRSVAAEDGVFFLERDTHWTPAGMEAVLDQLLAILRPQRVEKEGTIGEATTVTGPGDLVEMMDFPVKMTANQAVEVLMLAEQDVPTGEGANIVFLGDSFAAVYSDPVLGWGKSAGLRDRLPARLGEPVEFFLNYGDPVSGPTRQLRRLLESKEEGRKLPRVVIWEFAERFLDEGNW